MQVKELQSFRTPVQALSPEDQGFRQFVITDPEGVELPGIVEIEEVRLNGVRLESHVEHEVPTDTTHKRFDIIRMPLYQLIEGPRGVPTLLRSLNSNDGRWQVGSVLFVKGVWDSEKPAKKAGEPTDELDALKRKDLEAKADEFGIPFVGVKSDDLKAAIRAKLAE